MGAETVDIMEIQEQTPKKEESTGEAGRAFQNVFIKLRYYYLDNLS